MGIASVIRSLTHPVTRRRKWRNDVIKRLDELAKVQAVTAEIQGESAKLQMEMTKEQIEKMRPLPKLALITIIFWLVASAALIALGSYVNFQTPL